MNTARIVFTRPDGIVAVVCPSPEFVAKFGSEAEALAVLRTKRVPPDAQNVYECQVDEVYPPGKTVAETRRFRASWRQANPQLPTVDMGLARNQRLDEVRLLRKPRLTKSDADYLRAVETNNTDLRSSLATYRQTLRDLPATSKPEVAACATPDQLMAWEPTWPVDPAG